MADEKSSNISANTDVAMGVAVSSSTQPMGVIGGPAQHGQQGINMMPNVLGLGTVPMTTTDDVDLQCYHFGEAFAA